MLRLTLSTPWCAPADVTKHAVLGKFNEIRPGVYREFMKDVCEKARTRTSFFLVKVMFGLYARVRVRVRARVRSGSG